MDERVAAGLADTIKALRAELTTAMADGAGQQLQFQLGEIQLDVELAITRDAEAEGGVRFGVVSFGAKARLADEVTHRATLSLQPVQVDAAGVSRQAQVKDHAPEPK